VLRHRPRVPQFSEAGLPDVFAARTCIARLWDARPASRRKADAGFAARASAPAVNHG
jgi:hypothetical protein